MGITFLNCVRVVVPIHDHCDEYIKMCKNIFWDVPVHKRMQSTYQ